MFLWTDAVQIGKVTSLGAEGAKASLRYYIRIIIFNLECVFKVKITRKDPNVCNMNILKLLDEL